MASLYDLEVQESNDLIHAFIYNGETPKLRQMRVDLDRARAENNQPLVDQYLNQLTPLGQQLKRLTELEGDIKEVMAKNNLSVDLAKQVNQIFLGHPMSFSDLPEQSRQTLTTYWLRKKSCLADLIAKGYTFDELFSIEYYKPE